MRLIEHVNSAAGTVAATGSFASTGGGTWQTVAIVCSGTTTTIKINGVTVITRTQTGLTGSGKIGVCDRWAAGWFNNIVVTDSEAPTVSITAPADNANVSGSIPVTASASDNIGVVGVQFKLDGANLGTEDTTSPYSITWDTTTASNAQHVLTAVARDAAGNTTTSAGIFANVNNGLPSPWTTQDIGAVGIAGSASYASGTFTVAGSGTGIFGTADEFRFVDQSVTGDCGIIAHVTSVQNTGADAGWEHGGIIIRETLNTNSAYVGLYETSTHGILFEARTSTGASAVGLAADTTHVFPYWLKLTRGGNTFTAWISSNGTSWTTLGSPVTVSMASSVYVGLAATSEKNTTTCTAVFDNVSLPTGDFTPPTVSVTAPTSGAVVSGTAVSVSASASDNVGVVGVQFEVDGANLGSEITTAPYNTSWNTTSVGDGSHSITAVARDAAGNSTTSAAVAVTVNNSGSMLPVGSAYSENFDSGTAANWSSVSGTWGVSGGTYNTSTTGSHTAVYTSATWATNFILRGSMRSTGSGSSAKVGFVYNYIDANNYYKLLLAADGSAQLLKKTTATGGSEVSVATAAAGSYPGYYAGTGTDPWVEVEIDSLANATTVRANGARLFYNISQTDLGAGEVGFTDSGNTASFDNISVTPTYAVAYSQDFSGGSAPNWSSVSGTWAVSGASYNVSTSGSHDYTLYGASGATWLTNYTYSISVYSSLTGSSNKMGAIYNYVDASNYYEVLINGAGTAEIKKVVGGVTTSQGTASYVGGGANRWIEITLLRSGANTTVNVNGRRVFTNIAQGDLTTAGKVGVSAVSNSAAKFDDIVVTNGLNPYKTTFPKIAGNFISGGSQPWSNSTYQQVLAKHDAAVLGLYASWGGGGSAMQNALTAVKALNPNIVISTYTSVMEATHDSSQQTYIAAIDNKLTSEVGPGGSAPNDWYLRNNAAQGVSQYPGRIMTNTSYYVHADSGGQRWPQWYAGFEKTTIFDLSTQFDGMYEDNCLRTSPENNVTPTWPDWNRDGTNETWTSDPNTLENVAYRRGIASYMMKFGQLKPQLLLFGNIGGQTSIGGNPLALPEYQYLFNGALYESATGVSYSEETWLGWDTMMQGYRNLMDQTLAPHLVTLMARVNPDGTPYQQPGSGDGQPFPSGYACMRYTVASALLENGYICTIGHYYNIDDPNSYGWFDEFDQFLGHPTEPPVRTPLSNGAYMRHFQNGLVIVNPRTDSSLNNRSAVTIDLTGQGYKRFVGTQDPANNGSVVTTITVAAGDGVMLVKY